MINRIKHRIKIILGLTPKVPSRFTKDILIDENFHIGDYTYGSPIIHFKNKETKLVIGKFCSIAKNVSIFLGGNHRVDWISTYPFNDLPPFSEKFNHIKGHPSSKGDVVIGNDVWIGFNAIILSGVTIGNGAVIAAGSVVTKNIGDYEIWGGNPAKLIKTRFEKDKIDFLNSLEWWNWELSMIEKNAETLCSTNFNSLKKQSN